MEFSQVFLCKPEKSGGKTYTDLYLRPTLLLVPETQSNGSSIVVLKDVNSVSDGLRSLDYSDFTLNKMLESGISYKSIQISPDYRLGNDDVIDAFNDKLASMAEKLFVKSDTIE